MPRQSVTCIKPEDAPFIKRLKERVGCKEAVQTRSEREEPDRDEHGELEDEKPTVVVLREGDLTAEQVEALEADKAPPDGRILFQKPTKRKEDGDQKSGAKKSKGADGGSSVIKKSKGADGGSSAVKDARLLSFADEDEDTASP
ncbi:unnamed protein product [Ixodes hexagonus]